MPDQHQFDRLAAQLRQEASRGADAFAQANTLPASDHDTQQMRWRDFIGHWRYLSFSDQGTPADPMTGKPAQPGFMERELERIAPKGPMLPDGTQTRSVYGSDMYSRIVREARPDIYAAVTGDAGPLQAHLAVQQASTEGSQGFNVGAPAATEGP